MSLSCRADTANTPKRAQAIRPQSDAGNADKPRRSKELVRPTLPHNAGIAGSIGRTIAGI